MKTSPGFEAPWRRSPVRKLALIVALAALFRFGSATSAEAPDGRGSARPAAERFHEVGAAARWAEIDDRVEQSNAPPLVGPARWQAMSQTRTHDIEACVTHHDFARTVNDLFADTGVSHFHYYTERDWSYWHLLSVFFSDEPGVQVEHIGIVPERIAGRWFVGGILEGSPAESTRLRVGDELLSVDGEPYRPIASFRGRAGQQIHLTVRRRPRLSLEVAIVPVKESLHVAVQRAVRRSLRVIEHGRWKLAYLHGWTLLGAGEEYERLTAMQDQVDGLLLDYRDGFGGRWDMATRFLLGTDDDGDGQHRDPQWRKPVVVLIGDGTRSAKEIVVSAAQASGRALLVGEPSPGDVTSVGAVLRVGGDGLLMLPGHRFELEDHPTQPDVAVSRDLRYCAGADPQLKRALEVLVEGIVRKPQRVGGSN